LCGRIADRWLRRVLASRLVLGGGKLVL